MASGKANVKTIFAAAEAARADIETTLAGASGVAKLEADSARHLIIRVMAELHGWLSQARSSFQTVDPSA